MTHINLNCIPEAVAAINAVKPPLAAANVVQELATTDDPRLSDLFAYLLDQGSNLLVQLAAVDGIITCCPHPDRLLIPHLLDAHPIVQMKIISVIKPIATRAIVPALLAVLKQAQAASLRYAVIELLGEIRDPAALPAISIYADDPDHHVRERVATATRKLKLTML